jgi:hypothetical protein
MDANTLVERLGAEEAVRKMAAFQLQNQVLVHPLIPLIQDPEFARAFVAENGLVKLKNLISEATGNTLAYGLSGFAKLLQVPDVQAEAFGVVDDWLIERVLAFPRHALTSGRRFSHCPSVGEYTTSCNIDFGHFGISSGSLESNCAAGTVVGGSCRATTYSRPSPREPSDRRGLCVVCK